MLVICYLLNRLDTLDAFEKVFLLKMPEHKITSISLTVGGFVQNFNPRPYILNKGLYSKRGSWEESPVLDKSPHIKKSP